MTPGGSPARAVQLGPVPKSKESPQRACGEELERLAAPGSSWQFQEAEDEEATCLVGDDSGNPGLRSVPPQPLPSGGLLKQLKLRRPLALWVALAAMLVFFLSYLLSLHGGSHSRDVVWCSSHLGELKAAILTAVTSLTIALWATVAFPSALCRLGWQLLAALLALFLLFLAWDHGSDFQYHGAYNALLLVVVCLPLNLAIAGLYFWCRAMPSWRSFLASLAAASAVVALALAVRLLHYQQVVSAAAAGRGARRKQGVAQLLLCSCCRALAQLHHLLLLHSACAPLI